MRHFLQHLRRFLLYDLARLTALRRYLQRKTHHSFCFNPGSTGSLDPWISTLVYLLDDISQGLRLQDQVFQHAGFTRHQVPIHSRCVALESVSQITGVPSLLKNVLEIISFLRGRVSELHVITEQSFIHSIQDCLGWNGLG